MVNLEQATTSEEWSYVAAVDSVRRSEGKSYGAPGWEVGEERESRGQGWRPGLGLAVLAGKYELWWPEIIWEFSFDQITPKSGMSLGALLSCFVLWNWFRIAFECFLSALIPFPQYLFLEIWGWEGLDFIFLMNVFLFQTSTLLNLSASVSSSVKWR